MVLGRNWRFIIYSLIGYGVMLVRQIKECFQQSFYPVTKYYVENATLDDTGLSAKICTMASEVIIHSKSNGREKSALTQ